MKVVAREYKMLVRHEAFTDAPAAAKGLWHEVEDTLETVEAVRTRGKLDETESRRIVFLDTPDHTLRRLGLVLRQRAGEEVVDYTLKCRSEDRYFVAGTDMSA